MPLKKEKLLLILTLITIFLNCYSINPYQKLIKTTFNVDVCIYGATAAGINSAVAVAREGFSVVIIEPWLEIGGLMGTGFRMQQDVPYPDHLGGLTKEFYEKDLSITDLRHYQGASNFNIGFFHDMLNKHPDLIKLILNHRLLYVSKNDKLIEEAIFEYAPPDEYGVPCGKRASNNLTSVKAKIFIDASYEGDLMAYSGVSYRVGKESKNDYNESLAGIIIGGALNYRKKYDENNNKFPGVDPYIEEGNPESGLLSCISSEPCGNEGDSSRFFMGYNFKLSWEDNPSDEFPGIHVPLPDNKDNHVYILLQRYKKAGYKITWPHSNFQRGELMTGALPGMQLNYPDSDWEVRSKIWQNYIEHIKILTDFTGKDLYLLSDINKKSNGWPLLYIRGGRRMIGEYIMTQHDIQLQTNPQTPICLGYYKIDIYPNRLVVLKDGTLAHEGDVFLLASPGPYSIPYGAIIPQKKECENLLVPLCLSASHVAYSSIRMEATYMLIGESAGIAASLALKTKKAVQDINRNELTTKLKEYGQILKWNGKGYRKWRYNILQEPKEEKTRWDTNPEEYTKYPIEVLWK